MQKNQAERIDPLCKRLGEATNTRITVVLPSGEVIGDSHENPRDMENHKTRPEIQAALAGGTGRSERFSATEQEERRYAAIALLHGGAPAAVVRTSIPVTALTRTLDLVRDRMIMAAVLGALLYAVISLLISRRLSRPLEDIKAGAERFAAGQLNHRLRTAGSEEVGAVAEAMNHMAEQLNERIQTVLRQQNEREAMWSSMEEGVLAINNESRILSLNNTCAALLGGEAQKIEGHAIYEVIRKPDLLEFVERALASPTSVDAEIRIGGQQDRWVSATGPRFTTRSEGRSAC